MEQLTQTAHGPNPVLDSLARFAARVTGTRAAIVTLLDEHRQVIVSSHGLDETPQEIRHTTGGASRRGDVLADGTALTVADTGASDRTSIVGLPQIGAYAAVPIRLSDASIVGALWVLCEEPRRFTGDELAAIDDLAATAALELDREQTERRTDRAREFAAANVRTLQMIGEDPLGELLDAIVETFETGHPGLRGAVIGRDDAERRLTLAAPSLPSAWTATAAASGIDACNALDPNVVIETDLECLTWGHPGWSPTLNGLAASWSAPLLAATNRVIGRFTVYAPTPRAPTTAEIEDIAESAALAAAAIEHQRLAKDLHRRARHDELTGLRNRRRLLEDLAVACAAADAEQHTLEVFDLEGFADYNTRFGSRAGDALLQRLGHRLAVSCTDAGSAYRLDDDAFCVLVDVTGLPARAVRAHGITALTECGAGFSVTARAGSTVIDDTASTPEAIVRTAIEALRAGDDSGADAPGAVSELLQLLREHDDDLSTHIVNVAELAELTARELGLSDADVHLTRVAAQLHDIGKLGISNRLLVNPGPLDETEWAIMRRHTIIGQRILDAYPDLLAVGCIVRATHERYDGCGYPDGLADAAIPVSARIIAVCDTYDAITADRPYEPSRPPSDALAELRRCAGSQFDPHVVECFCAVEMSVTA